MHLADLLKLSGIVIVVIGLALRLRTTLVVVTAGLVTGIAAGLPLFSSDGIFQALPFLTKPGQEGIINMLGRAFAENRLMTLFIITLPAIGLAERYGLQEQSAVLIRRFAAATVGGFTSPLGAVVGGLLVGVTENLVGTYVSFIGTELKLTVALAMIIIVLLVRPSGLFGRSFVRRV